MVRSITAWLDEREAEYEAAQRIKERGATQLNSESYRAAVLDSAHEALDKAIALADKAQEHLTEAEEAITTVRSQRDASLELLKRYEAERFSYRMQGYAFGFILGVIFTFVGLS